jgi:tetratricopeptide (TPR) repeat protein
VTSLFSCALGLLVTCSLVCEGSLAHAAEPSDPAAAEALFAQGRALLQRGDYGQACPMLQESYRLDPATGALLAVALCHEGQGKLASAWVEFMNVAALAHAEHNSEREQSARTRAEALGPRLSYLVLRVSPEVAALPGLVLLHDDVALRPAAWGTPIPVDPGRHVLSASAPGRKAWQTTISIVEPAQRGVVELTELMPLEVKAEGRAAPSPPPRRAERPPMTPLRLAGVGALGAGATALLFAAGASWRALSKNSNAKPNCTPSPCNSSGVQQRAAANEAANFATVGALAGGALVGAGVALFVLGKPSEARAKHARWSLGLTLAGAELRREF